MLGEGAEIPHDQFRLTKHPRVEALQDKVRFSRGIQGYQEGVIDIAAPIFPDIQDPAWWRELLGNGNQIVQGFYDPHNFTLILIGGAYQNFFRKSDRCPGQAQER